MQKIPIVLTLACLAAVITAMPRASIASCGTPVECYETALKKLEQAQALVKAQRQENEQLQSKIAEMEKTVAENRSQIQCLQNQVAKLEKTAFPKRYLDNGDGTVTDIKTWTIWLKNANCFGQKTWNEARHLVRQLKSGSCGLRDGSKASDWRLPTRHEWEAMLNGRYRNPALSNAAGTGRWKESDAFLAVKLGPYWALSAHTNDTDRQWDVHLDNGNLDRYHKAFTNYVWPVRGGQ